MQIQNPNHKKSWLCASIGRKQVIGLTGLGLSFFVLTHMLGNMLIFVGPQAYNEYSHKLTSNPLIYLAEVGLVALFFAHMSLALRLALSNYCARGATQYAVLSNGEKGTSWVKRSLWAQGLLILVFAISHLITFKFGHEYIADYGSGGIRDIHKLVIEVFHDPIYVFWYAVALVVLGFHLSHGLGSSFQTLGLYHPRFQKCIRGISIVYALIVSLGFLSQPIYVFFVR